MKYIRTKDGRILEFDKMITPCIYKTKPNKKGVYEEIGNGWVYRLANTIEELCDEFVIKTDHEYLHAQYYYVDKTFYIYNTDEEISLEECLRFNYVIYGAIWTDKGLIYVAKMNDKGELELL